MNYTVTYNAELFNTLTPVKIQSKGNQGLSTSNIFDLSSNVLPTTANPLLELQNALLLANLRQLPIIYQQ